MPLKVEVPVPVTLPVIPPVTVSAPSRYEFPFTERVVKGEVVPTPKELVVVMLPVALMPPVPKLLDVSPAVNVPVLPEKVEVVIVAPLMVGVIMFTSCSLSILFEPAIE